MYKKRSESPGLERKSSEHASLIQAVLHSLMSAHSRTPSERSRICSKPLGASFEILQNCFYAKMLQGDNSPHFVQIMQHHGSRSHHACEQLGVTLNALQSVHLTNQRLPIISQVQQDSSDEVELHGAEVRKQSP